MLQGFPTGREAPRRWWSPRGQVQRRWEGLGRGKGPSSQNHPLCQACITPLGGGILSTETPSPPSGWRISHPHCPPPWPGHSFSDLFLTHFVHKATFSPILFSQERQVPALNFCSDSSSGPEIYATLLCSLPWSPTCPSPGNLPAP